MAGTHFQYRKVTNLVLSNLCNLYIYVIYVSNVKQRGNKNLITVIGADDNIDDNIIKINLFFSEKDMEFINSFKFGSILRFQRLKITQLHSNQKSYMGKGDLDDKGFNIINFPQSITIDDIIKSVTTTTPTFKPITINTNSNFTWEDSDKTILIKMKNDWNNELKSYWEDYLLNQRGYNSLETGIDSTKNINNTTTTTTTGNTTTTTTATTNTRLPSSQFNGLANKKPKLSTEFKFTSIENLEVNKFVSVAAKILDKCFPIGNGGKRANIKLWDGTGQDVIWDNDTPTLGSSIFANTWEQTLIDALDEIPIGSWVAITGAKVGVYKDILELKLFRNSKISILPNDHGSVIAILSNYKKRIEDDEQLQKQSNDDDDDQDGSGQSQQNNNNNNNNQDEQQDEQIHIKLTETHYPHIPITNISEVISENQTVPNKFKLHVSLVQHLPLNLQDFTRVYCNSCKKAADFFDKENNHRDNDLVSCSHCGSNLIEYIFLFKLILKDQTGTIPVIFSNQANFFLNMLPLNLYHNAPKLSMLESKMKLLKKKNATFDICIMSYYEANKERVYENIKYQVFDTKLSI